MKSTNNKYEVGQFVRWYEAYADGFLGRDAGWGIIKSFSRHTIYGDYITYTVLRNKHGDVMTFSEEYIEGKEEFKKRMHEQKTDNSICS